VTYAAGTTVTVAKSKGELDALLSKYGATQRGVAEDDAAGVAIVAFTLARRQFRMKLPMPKFEAFARDPRSTWKRRTAEQQRKAFEQACRERWRAVVLVVKAKLELVQLGVTSVEQEFLAYLVLPDGSAMHEAVAPRIAAAYETGEMPRFLLGMGDGS
jgi:hypothetical protein